MNWKVFQLIILVFDIIRHIKDPEHPLSLEQLNVVSIENVAVEGNRVTVKFTPTIPHCSSASVIGLTIISKLRNALPELSKVLILFKWQDQGRDHKKFAYA